MEVIGIPKSFINPILPGWNSDPSCIFVPEADNTFFCTTSSFLAYPGLPIYASKDLQNWFLISNALHHPSQLPYFTNTSRPDEGIFASTLRYHKGTYHLSTVFYGVSVGIFKTLLFETTDPLSQSAWGVPLECPTLGYDPDLFFDDDGQSYITASRSTNGGIVQAPIDLATGQLTGEQYHLWNGSGGAWPEGPHIYKKDGFYYLMIAEGGISVDHMETIARSENLAGPYTSYTKNPILTNRNSSEYFQTVGHADLFQDAEGNWFGAALATRSGPQWENFPMGRETVLFPVTWDEGQWPKLDPVRGIMDGLSLPPRSRWSPPGGDRNPVAGRDVVDFAPGSSFPKHFLHWSIPGPSAYRISPNGHPYSLGLRPSNANLTGDISLPTAQNRTLVARKQAHSLFTFEVDILFRPSVNGEEAGVTVFLTPQQHLDLGIGLLDQDAPSIFFRVVDIGCSETGDLPAQFYSLPKHWQQRHVRLQVRAVNETTYRFAASLAHDRDHDHSREYVFYAPATVVSAGIGHFTGSLLGVYVTANGGNGTTGAYVSRWRYTPVGQVVDYGVVIPSGRS
ncbi:glycoside hydrolase family 43 protein [Aspergillus pseudoustus]|uniref:Glycoside hydrolase family 43 protein n=1 Tax=Aspergillus pseudoustus TaxID=1810923 RepID=A0ABR4JDH9_9EURO